MHVVDPGKKGCTAKFLVTGCGYGDKERNWASIAIYHNNMAPVHENGSLEATVKYVSPIVYLELIGSMAITIQS